MKEGQLVETGTHEELMKNKGEYFNLYTIQAQAFA
jgi:ABC-type multidrug transport system fused ATPase/permease subunit